MKRSSEDMGIIWAVVVVFFLLGVKLIITGSGGARFGGVQGESVRLAGVCSLIVSFYAYWLIRKHNKQVKVDKIADQEKTEPKGQAKDKSGNQ